MIPGWLASFAALSDPTAALIVSEQDESTVHGFHTKKALVEDINKMSCRKTTTEASIVKTSPRATSAAPLLMKQ
jgi:hypothetical protein